MDSSIQKYIAFIQTVESGSFTKAAGTLSYAQSTVSKMIADLEKAWGIKLIQRSRAGIQLTADGQAMLPYARALVGSYHKVQEQAAMLNGIVSGLIRIGTFSSVATHWMPRIIKAFQKDYPNIEYELLLGDYSEIEQWIANGRVECGFLRLPTRKDFTTISIAKDELVVVLPPKHPLAKKRRISPSDLDNQPFMLLEHGGKTEVSQLLDKYNIHPDIRFTSWDDYAVMSMIESGFGIGILPRLILRRIPYRIAVRSLDVSAYREIGLAFRNQESLSAAAKCFIQRVRTFSGRPE